MSGPVITLQSLRHYPETNHVEATWVQQVGTRAEPDPEFPDDPQRSVLVPNLVPVVHRAYAASQMGQLVVDLGPADAAKHSALIAQVSASYTPPPPAPPPVPERVTMRQARLALNAAGKLAAVQAAIDAMQEPARTSARIEWEYSAEMRRAHPLIAQLAPALNMTAAQIDALFVSAQSL